ncbi:MAG: hypothetical protein WC728_12350 [Elusimicrobiota bacterium]
MNILLLLLSLAASSPGLCVQVEPLANVRVLGGQYFFEGERGAPTGNVSALVAPALVLSESWTLLPALSGEYQGTKQVVDLVGSGSMFQERAAQRGGVKAVFTPAGSRWRLKPSLSYGFELLNETKDERWGRGLFDTRRWVTGLEAEYAYAEPFSVRLSYDYCFTAFPNYTALESEAALDFQGQPLARELVGEHVLDSHMHLITLAGTRRLWGRTEGAVSLAFRRQTFTNQALVDASGELRSETRGDFGTAFRGSVHMPLELTPEVRLLGGLGFQVFGNASDQASYDAKDARFMPGYYNYIEFGFEPWLKASMGDEREPITLSLAGAWTSRSYSHRLVQDSAGAYQGETLRQRTWTLSATLSYPLAPRLSALFSLQHGQASSNQGFQSFYSYDYSATNYLMGLSWEY